MDTTKTRISKPFYDEREAKSGTKRAPGKGWTVTVFKPGVSVEFFRYHHDTEAWTTYRELCARYGVEPEDPEESSVTSITSAKSASQDVLAGLAAMAAERGIEVA